MRVSDRDRNVLGWQVGTLNSEDGLIIQGLASDLADGVDIEIAAVNCGANSINTADRYLNLRLLYISVEELKRDRFEHKILSILLNNFRV